MCRQSACDSSSTYKDNKVIRATTIKQINGTGMIELILPYIERFILRTYKKLHTIVPAFTNFEFFIWFTTQTSIVGFNGKHTFISGVKIDQKCSKRISEKLVPFKINYWKTAENTLLFLSTPMTRSQQTQPDQTGVGGGLACKYDMQSSITY
uniref:Uncharacterized protein n=1 Tax=Glossina austeni TaxID=7395 RepID=A0A1A9VCB7_GLOAU